MDVDDDGKDSKASTEYGFQVALGTGSPARR